MSETQKTIEYLRKSIKTETIYIPLKYWVNVEQRKELINWLSEFMDKKLPFKCSYRVCGLERTKIKVEIPGCYISRFVRALSNARNLLVEPDWTCVEYIYIDDIATCS